MVFLTSVDGKIIENEPAMRQGLAEVGEFCPNKGCAVYEQDQNSHIVRYGKTAAGVKRYQCWVCGKRFTATKGTLF